MARWGIADDGDVIEVAGPDDVVEAVLVTAAPPLGVVWRSTQPPRMPVQRRIEVDADADGRIDVRVDGHRRAGGADAVESELALFAAERLEGLVAVHAAVLRVESDVVVIPGRSHSGKSTWCAAALDAGHEVWSDEFALVDRVGCVRGWPRPLRLRTASGVVRRALSPTAQAPVGASAGAPVAVVAAVAHGARHEVRGLSESEAIGVVLANVVCAQRRPEESFAAAVALVRGARCVGGTRGEADDAVRWLADMLGRGAGSDTAGARGAAAGEHTATAHGTARRLR
ncbi:MAG: hypothetical protein ACO3C1_11180 [Ilumatobacteraceae bacterium]